MEFGWNLLSLAGGLALFLFGMRVMGESLEKCAGNRLKGLLGRLTAGRFRGLLLGAAVTALIQSSSAVTVMAVGFVNSGLMSLSQVVGVIFGANLGTTLTAWILSLTQIEGDSFLLRLFKPESFTPILALIGIVLYLFSKRERRRDAGGILLGFAVLFFGMDTMSAAVEPLSELPAFQEALLRFRNPILGLAAGAVLTAILQSSSAAVGVLQALSGAGRLTAGAAIPIIMGQNIGTCVTALLSSVGATKNAKRAAFVHLSFNVIGTVVWLAVYTIVDALVQPALFDTAAEPFGIAIAHSIFNIACTILLLPLTGLLEKIAMTAIREPAKKEKISELDERLLATPPIALERASSVAGDMAKAATRGIKDGLMSITSYSKTLADSVRENEDKGDYYEDILGTYLVKLSGLLSGNDSTEAAKLLHIIGDFERISDHAVELVAASEEMQEKGIKWSESGSHELEVMTHALREIVDLTLDAFANNNMDSAAKVEPLEQVIDQLKETLRAHHIERLQKGECTIEAGFIWSDLLTAMERTSDHCSNIAGCVIDIAMGNMNLHESLRAVKAGDDEFDHMFEEYAKKYTI